MVVIDIALGCVQSVSVVEDDLGGIALILDRDVEGQDASRLTMLADGSGFVLTELARIGSLYIQKWVAGTDAPKRLTVAVEETK